MIKKSLIWSYRVAYIALGTFVFLGLLSIIGLRYFVLPHIDDYKPKIVQGLSQILGQKVTIGNIYANWDNLNPHLSVFNVDIYDKENRIALSLRHIEGSLSWTSIPLLEPRLASFSIYQPELTIRREKDGTIYVAGVSMSGPSKPEFPNWLLRQAQVNVIDANIIWQDDLRGAPALNLEKLNLALENPAWDSLRGHHNFSLRAIPQRPPQNPSTFVAGYLAKTSVKLSHGMEVFMQKLKAQTSQLGATGLLPIRLARRPWRGAILGGFCR